ncbi:MAG: hypothetical protein ACE5HB_09805 [Terriglobia bacterium]
MGSRQRRPRIGEKRQRNYRVKLDRFPPEVREEIQRLYATEGKTWEEIEELSQRFVPWGELKPEVRRLFPKRKLPHSTLQRWYDLRIAQVQREVMVQAERARALAASFVGKSFEELDASVRNSLATQVFALLEAHDQGNQAQFRKEVAQLGWLLARYRQLDQEAARIEVERQKLAQVKRQGEALAADLEQAARKGKEVNLKKLAKQVRQVYEG